MVFVLIMWRGYQNEDCFNWPWHYAYSSGHEVLIINTKNGREIIDKINTFRPDFVHVHYDEFVPLVPFIQYPNAITSHYGYLERPKMFGGIHEDKTKCILFVRRNRESL